MRAAKPARWKFRTRPAGWLPPSLRHRVRSALRWVRWIVRFAGAGGADVRCVVEVSPFDVAKLRDPSLEGSEYQRGPLYRANLRAVVFTRDGAWCLYCGGRERLQIDHVVPRTAGGSDAPHNRVAACHSCNHAKDHQELRTWLEQVERETPPSGRDRLKKHHHEVLRYTTALAAGHAPLHAAAAVNLAALALAKEIVALGEVSECTGADTASWRAAAKLPKTHWVDALCAAMQGHTGRIACGRPVRITMTGRGRRLVVPRNASGFPRLDGKKRIVGSHRATPPHGLRAGDAVQGRAARKDGRIVRGTPTAARHDGRCVVGTTSRNRINVMAHTLR